MTPNETKAFIKEKALSFKSLVGLLNASGSPRDFASLKQHVIESEMRETSAYFESLLQDESISLEEIKASIKSRCAERSRQNIGTAIGLSALFSGASNELYIVIVTVLFSPKTLPELLGILSPETKTVISPSLATHLPEAYALKTPLARKAAFKALSYKVSEESLADITHPETLSMRLSEYVFFEDKLFYVGELAGLRFKGQLEFYDALLDKAQRMHEALYSHNTTLRALKDDVLMYQNKGLTPRESLQRFAKGLVLGGQKMSGEIFARRSAIEACAVFTTYMDSLDEKLRERLYALKSVSGKTLKAVLSDLDRGNCVETASKAIEAILENKANKSLLDTRPVLTALQLKALEEKYQDSERFSAQGDESYHLPQGLLTKALKAIKVSCAEDLVILLLNFDEGLYETLLSEITLQGNKKIMFDGLMYAIANDYFSKAQKASLIPALMKNIERYALSEIDVFIDLLSSRRIELAVEVFKVIDDDVQMRLLREKNEVGDTLFHIIVKDYYLFLEVLLSSCPELSWLELVKERDSFGKTPLFYAVDKFKIFKLLLDLYPEKLSRLEAVKEKNYLGSTVLHEAVRNPRSLKMILALLPECSRLEAVREKNDAGNTVLCYAALKPESLKVILESLPEASRLKVINEKNEDGLTVLHEAACNPESLKVILNLLLDSSCFEVIKEKTKDGCTVLHKAANIPNSLRLILDVLSETSRLELIKEKNKGGNTVLHEVARKPESLKLILDSLPETSRLKLIKEKSIHGNTLLHEAAYNLESLTIILYSLPETSRLELIKEQNKRGNTVLHEAVYGFESLKIILGSLSEPLCVEAIKVKNKEGNTALHLCANKPECLKVILGKLSEKDKLNALKSININKSLVLSYFDGSAQLSKGIDSPLMTLLETVSAMNKRHARVGFFFSATSFPKLKNLLALKSLVGVGESVYKFLKENSTETSNLLDCLVVNHKGDTSKGHAEKLAFIQGIWEASGLLPAAEVSLTEPKLLGVG